MSDFYKSCSIKQIIFNNYAQPIWKLYHNQGRIQGGRGNIRHPLTDIMRGVAPLNLEFFVPIFRIASQ